MPAHRHQSHASGFSLVEVMVGIVIAMVASLVMLQVFATFEERKRTTNSGSDAQTDGAIASFTIERDVRMAGYGLNMPELLGCKINSSFDRGPTVSFTLAPATITNGANGLPDSIRVVASSKKKWSVPARITTDHPPQATNMFLNTTQGIEVGDLIVAAQAGKDCTLMQVTNIPNGNVQIHHHSTSPWNPPGGQNIFPPGGYTKGAMLFNFGGFTDHTYSVDARTNLQLSDFRSATNTSAIQPLVSGIVNLQAQYGFDTRVGTLTDGRVDRWSDTMIDADGNGITGDAGDIGRIYAVRFAIVARSVQMERPKSDGTCSITTTTSTNRPVWSGGDIDVSKNPDGSANSNWTCYRYKVTETVVPLRNLLWREW